MSRIGKLPISIPESIKISLNLNEGEVILESGKTKKNYKVSSGIVVEYKDKQIKYYQRSFSLIFQSLF